MEQFGKYRLVRRIGTGGMAEVYLANTTVAQGLAKQLVIKKIHPAFARSRQFVSMFVDEAKIALGLNHPNIVQVFDFGQVGETFYLAMEYVEGCDLLRVMKEASRQGQMLPLGLCAYVVQQVAKGLDYAHRKVDEYGEPLGIVHRDISPQNVLVSWDGAVKIVDFGIARARDVQEEEGVVKGKFAYMAPEQARGELVDRRADVFSAGVVLFELCCGQPLFPGKGKEVLEKVREGKIPRARDLNPDIPDDLDETIYRALTFERDQRFQTGRDLQNELGRFQFRYAQSHDALIDSGSLAQFLAQVLPQAKRPSQRPPTAPGTSRARSRASGTDAPTPDDDSRQSPSSTSSGSSPRRDIRERKHVFVVRGIVRGRESLDQRVGAAEARRIVADFVGVAKDIAFKHEAHVHETDDSGLTLAIGLPVASDDDANRAIRVALALVDALDGIGHDVEPELRLAVGVQRGAAVVTRPREGGFRYELGSPTTSIAERLAHDAAGAEILVGGNVYQVARDDWNFERLRSIELPAGEGPDTGTDVGSQSRVYRLRGPKEREQRLRERSVEVDLLGRDLELKALRDAYRNCRVDGASRLLVVTGEAGIGKRALVNTLLRGIPSTEATILRATGRAATSFTPFGIIADFGRDMLGLAEGAEPREIRRRIELLAATIYPDSHEDPDIQALIDASCLLFGIRREGARALEPDELRQMIVKLGVRLEERLSPETPMVIVVEDVHWADEQSMALFRDLLTVPNTRGQLIVITSRPEPRVIKLAADSHADIIPLPELGAEERIELIRRRFAPDEDVTELTEQIVARSGGNPFFITEMIDSLVDRGSLVAEPADSPQAGLLRWVDRGAALQIPTSVEALLAARIDQLPDELKDTLIHAAILGARLAPADVEPLVGRPVDADLAGLVERGLLKIDGNGFAFRNDVTVTVAYRMLPEDDRNQLHRAVARRLASGPSYRPGQDDPVIARHLELAGAQAAAAERYLRAANHAVNVGGNADAFRQLTRALRLLDPDDHGRRFTARLQREEILRRLAKRPAQLREIAALRDEAEAIGDPAKMARAHARLAQYYIEVGKAQAASKAVAPALQYAREAGDVRAEAEALRLRSSVARTTGQSSEALRLCDQALALLGDDRESLAERALILNNRGTTLWNMDRLNEAIEAYAEGLVIYRSLGLPRQEARALNNMGIVFSALGDPEEALAHYKSSLKIDQRLGDRAQIALKLGNIGQTYAEIGDLDRGEKYLAKALKLTESVDDRASMVDIVNTLGQVELSRGRHQQALDHLSRARDIALELQNRYQEIRALVYLSLAVVELGDQPAEALELAESATRLAREMPMPVGEVHGLAVQGLALADLGRQDEALVRSGEAVDKLESSEQSEGREQILSIHARLLERAGRTTEAASVLRRADRAVQKRADQLSDPRLRATYLAAPIPARIRRDVERLCGSSSASPEP